MTHFKVDIQLPLKHNPESGEDVGKEIPKKLFFDAYEKFLSIGCGVHTTNTPVFGSWIHPNTKQRYNDNTIVFTIVVDSEDKVTVANVDKIKLLKEYKEVLKTNFKQNEIYMVATRCSWL